MKIIVLTENHAGGQYGAEHGLSYFIESKGFKLLLDTGHSDLFLRNAEKGGINLNEEVDTIVLSHGHWDHGNGLEYLQGKKLICHPGSFMKRYRKGGIDNIGLNRPRSFYSDHFDLEESIEPLEIFPSVFFLGEIPRKTSFESRVTPFTDELDQPDYVPDDSAIAIVSDNKLSVLSGCAHSGIVNIIEHAREVSRVYELKMVIGGFHLKQRNEQTMKTLEFFKKNPPEILIPSHCTDLPALTLFHDAFKTPFLKTGDIINF
ncbi:MAG: MBL fold metallo-hydrolase [Bacteroidota bacterium]